MSRQDIALPTSLDAARRERRSAAHADHEPDFGHSYVAAADVVALLNRVGECVRALPSFGRTRTQTSAVVAKRTLSAISTCSPAGLAENDELRAVLARLDVTRGALRVTALSGAQRIAALRWLEQHAAVDDPAATTDDGLPTHSYMICNGQVIRQPGDHDEGGGEELRTSREERIDDLARAGALDRRRDRPPAAGRAAPLRLTVRSRLDGGVSLCPHAGAGRLLASPRTADDHGLQHRARR